MTILLLDPMHDTGPDWLEQRGYHAVRAWLDEPYDPAEVKGVVFRISEVNAELLDRFPNLKVAAKHGVGVNNVDFAETDRRGIKVTFTPGAATTAVAEHGVAMLFAASRRVIAADRAARNADFDFRHRVFLRELSSRRLGIVGAGRIGGRLGEICRDGMQMPLGVYDPYASDEAVSSLGAQRFDSVIELFTWAEVAAITVPRTPETEGLVGRDELAALGPDGVIAVVSRGGVVDEAALHEAVKDEVIWGAGVDVFDVEPPSSDNPLFELENAVFSPHAAGITNRGVERMSSEACANIVALLEGGEAPLAREPA